MIIFLIKKISKLVWVFLALSILCFLLVRLLPGDTASIILGLRYSAQAAELIHQKMGLDKSLFEQYFIWLSQLLQADWGISSSTGEAVLPMLLDKLKVSFSLIVVVLAFSFILSPILVVLTLQKRFHSLVNFSRFLSFTFLAIPHFWLATLLILFFCVHLDLLPSGGYQEGLSGFSYLILPALSLSLSVTSILTRMSLRTISLEMKQNYVLTARAKGLSNYNIFFGHILKNISINLVTMISLQLSTLIAGSILIEQIFSIPGYGQLMLSASKTRDYPLLQGILVLTGCLIILIQALTDTLQKMLDPRIEGA